jgi:TolA-binding protein
MRDLKNLYVEENMVDSYVEFASQAQGVAVNVSEHDSLSYKAAEIAYARGDEKAATEAFTKYLSQFSTGAYTTDAQYYLGCIYYKNNNYDKTKTYLSQVASHRSSKYCEEATRMLADLAYNHKDYTLALDSYTRLIAITNNPTIKLNAQVNLLRSAQVLGKHDIVVQHSQATLANSILPPEVAIEIHYYRAKAYLAQKKNEAAIDDLCRIAVDTRNIYGAEAKYQLAQIYYDIKQYDNAEKEVLDYINVSTPHSYWLARSFVLLADVYMKNERYIEAKQYLISLKQSYQAKDDIASMIESRLKTLESMMNY